MSEKISFTSEGTETSASETSFEKSESSATTNTNSEAERKGIDTDVQSGHGNVTELSKIGTTATGTSERPMPQSHPTDKKKDKDDDKEDDHSHSESEYSDSEGDSYNYFEEMYGDSDYDDYDDDDDDDGNDEDSDCPCSQCTSRREMFRLFPSFMFSDDYDDLENENDEDDEDDDESESDEDDGDQGTTQCCAICFMKPKKSNPIIRLPCCDPYSSTETSSTRFCGKCVRKSVKTQGVQSATRSSFYIGECPRCRSILRVDTDDGSIKKGIFSQIIEYAVLKHPTRDMRDMLAVCAYSNPNFLPAQLLKSDQDSAARLISWGLLKKSEKAGSVSSWLNGLFWKTEAQTVYTMDRALQNELQYHITHTIITVSEEEPHVLVVASSQNLAAAIYSLLKLRLWTAARLFNQSCTNGLIYLFDFPQLQSNWQEFAMMALNIFFALMFLKVLLMATIYLSVSLVVLKFVAWLFVLPGKIEDFRSECDEVGVKRALFVDDDGQFKHSLRECMVYGLPVIIGIFTMHYWAGRTPYQA